VGSVRLPDTLAVFVTWPAAVVVTTMVTVAEAPFASEPSEQLTVAVPEAAALDEEADFNVTPAGSSMPPRFASTLKDPPIGPACECRDQFPTPPRGCRLSPPNCPA
jgi:hypothetical protein